MSGIVQTLIGSFAGAVKDAFFEYVSLLLPGSGTNGAQNNTFLDGSTNNFTITRNGNTTQGTFSPYGNNWSNYFDGAGDYLTSAGNSIGAFGTGNFTVEYWIYYPSFQTNKTVIDCRNSTTSTTGYSDYYTSAGKFALYLNNSNIYTSTATVAVNTWNHIAVCRAGTGANQTLVFINGVQDGTFTYSTNVTDTGCIIGSNQGDTGPINAYISNLRVVKGTAVYTAAFTPPTAPLTAITNTSLLTCQSNRFIDNSTNAFAITRNGDVSVQRFSPFSPSAAYSASVIGGSGYFDGAGDYLSIADNAALQLTGDFTIEFWVYATVVPASRSRIFVKGNNAANDYNLDINSTGTLTFGNNASFTTSTGATTYNAWNHVAITRSGSASNNCTYWINGVASGNFTTTQSFNNTNALWIGQNQGATPLAFTGYISNFRIVKGTAVYTAAFTPPTAPLAAITNTSLLLNFTNAGIIDNAMMNDLETVGNAQISNAQAKWGSTSISFDGTGDWLVMPDLPPQRLGTGDFTIEGWLRINATGVAYGVISKGTATTGWSVNVTSGNKLQFSYTATQLTGATSLAANTWYHFAVVRNGTGTGNLKIYLDGTADATSAGAVTDNFNQTNVQYVGANRTGGDALNGYVQDARVTTGYARYTANFTAPTAAFPTS